MLHMRRSVLNLVTLCIASGYAAFAQGALGRIVAAHLENSLDSAPSYLDDLSLSCLELLSMRVAERRHDCNPSDVDVQPFETLIACHVLFRQGAASKGVETQLFSGCQADRHLCYSSVLA